MEIKSLQLYCDKEKERESDYTLSFNVTKCLGSDCYTDMLTCDCAK